MEWSIVPMGTLCSIQSGKSDTKDAVSDGPYAFFDRSKTVKRSSRFLRDCEALIIPGEGTEFLPRHFVGKFDLHQRAYALFDFRPEIDPRFLFYFLHHSADYFPRVAVGATVKSLRLRHFEQLPVSVTDISNQRRIVSILDEAFEGIAAAKANAEKNLQNALEVFSSHRDELMSGQVGWLEAPLANLCDVKHGYAFEGEFFAQEGQYVLLTPGSFYESGGYRERGSKTKYFIGPIPSDYILDENALLVAMTEQAAGLLGSPLLVPEANRFLHNQRLGLVKAKPGVPWANEFFFHAFNVARVRQEIHASSSGVKVRHTSPGKIGAVRVAYPNSLEEQRLVASRLFSLSQECERLADIQNRKLAALDELKKSLLHQAFTGQL